MTIPGLSTREAVAHLADLWFGPVSSGPDGANQPPPLNDERLSDAEKQAAILLVHVGQRRPWPALSTNESTFYRYRRAAFSAFIERCWAEISKRVIPTNRPRPEYDRFVGRSAERTEIIRRLAGGYGSILSIEGPGGTGKTALAHSIVSLCLGAARDWRSIVVASGVTVPLFDAIVWVGSRQEPLDLGVLLDTV